MFIWVMVAGTSVSISVVTLRQARLILGCVTVYERVNHLRMQPASQVDLAFYPLWDGKMSISL